MSLRTRIVRRARLMALAHAPAPTLSRWTFVVGWDEAAVDKVARELCGPEGTVVSGPENTDALPRPETFRVPHTWGNLPVHFALEAHEPGVDHERVRRQWAHAASPATQAIVTGGVNALRIPWLLAHWPGCAVVVADLPPTESVAWIRARSGVPLDQALSHVRRVHAVVEHAHGPQVRWQPVSLGTPPLLTPDEQRQVRSSLG